MTLTPDHRRSLLADLVDWRYNMCAFHTAFEARSGAEALELIARIAAAAGEQLDHVDVDWRQQKVFVRLSDLQAGDVGEVDAALAARISALAAGIAVARPELVRTIEVAIDATDAATLAPTWAAALGYRIDTYGNLFDPVRRGPALWFQQTDTPATSRLHIDVSVADDRGDAVLSDVVAAGGRRIDDRFRPSFTVVADADGNRVCICTQLGRD